MKQLKPIHKFNGGLGATLCHNCSVIINTGLTDSLYCNTCGPNKVTYLNRHRDKIIFEHIGDEVIMTGGTWFRFGLSNEDDSINMVDPSGGPYIQIEDNLKEFWPKGKYQDLLIESISFKDGNESDNSSTVVFKLKPNAKKKSKAKSRTLSRSNG